MKGKLTETRRPHTSGNIDLDHGLWLRVSSLFVCESPFCMRARWIRSLRLLFLPLVLVLPLLPISPIVTYDIMGLNAIYTARVTQRCLEALLLRRCSGRGRVNWFVRGVDRPHLFQGPAMSRRPRASVCTYMMSSIPEAGCGWKGYSPG